MRGLLKIAVALLCLPAWAGLIGMPGGSASSSGGFVPQSGYTVTGSPTDGGTITITAGAGGFVDGSDNAAHTKPFAVAPLLWAPMDSTLDGSALGRISGAGTWKDLGGLAWSSGCGPTGSSGCASGSGNQGDGSTGVQTSYTGAIDLDEWTGWASQNSGNGYYWNDLGRQMYVYRQTEHVGFGHLDFTAADSYNSVGSYNVKIFRVYSRVSTNTNGYPDVYYASSNETYYLETCPGSNCGPNVSSGAPHQYINATTTGTPDVLASIPAQQSFDGMSSGAGEYNAWRDEEIYSQANSSASASTYPPTSQFWYVVVGENSDQPLENWPVSNYQNNVTGVNWMLVDSSSLQTSGLGTIQRVFPIHYIVDGTGGRPDMPSGAYVNYHGLYLDDSWCHAVIQDSSTYNSATAREIQIPTTEWNDTQLQLDLRKGQFPSLSGEYLFVIPCDASSTTPGGGALLIGHFSSILAPALFKPWDAANDSEFRKAA